MESELKPRATRRLEPVMKRILLPAAFLLAFSLPAQADEKSSRENIEKLIEWTDAFSTKKSPGPFPLSDQQIDETLSFVHKNLEDFHLELTPKQWSVVLGILSHALYMNNKVSETETSETASLPPYDSGAYCDKITERAGGSNSIRKGCMQNEKTAQRTLSTLSIPEKTIKYCDRVAKRAGGSYWIFHGCVINESQ